MVEEYLKNEGKMDDIAVDLDPENEQDISECLMEEDEMHPDFEHLDPSGLENPDKDQVKKEKMFKPIDVGNIDELREKTKKMDFYQKFVIEVAVKFARGIIKAMKPKNRKPIPPMLMVHGGAGSGKSTVINTLARWVQ